MRFAINGKFLTQRTTGVQRFARELILELDKIVSDDDICLITSKDFVDTINLKKIKIIGIGNKTNFFWLQILFPIYCCVHGLISINLCGSGPLLNPGVVCMHDVGFIHYPDFVSKKFYYWGKLQIFNSINRSKCLLTVSNFSKNDIETLYPKSKGCFHVIPNGWQHFERITYDENTLNKYDLSKDKFYFAMSSMAPNKNFKWIAKAAKNNPEMLFAVSGAINTKVFGDIFDFEVPDNLKFLGYVSDEEAKTLMRDCKAFLFPTFYEGFGIPPLEALSTGAKVVVSAASCMREIFEDSVYYIDPYNADIDLNKLLDAPVESSEKILNKFSWRKSAEKLLELF